MKLLLVILICCLIPIASFAQSSSNSLVAPDADGLATPKLALSAKLVEKGEPIERGLVWRIFGNTEGEDGTLPLIATAQGGSASFDLPTGTYLIHAAFGHAGATKRITLESEGSTETFVLDSGGLELDARTGDADISASDLRFSIYEREEDEKGNRKLIAFNVAANKVVRLNAGTYHVLSRYGTINATVRADLEVKAGRLTKAILEHRGANISMRLVSQKGGDPIANTAWTVFTADGEQVFASSTTSPRIVLAEGSYEAAVRYGDRTLRKSFEVTPGKAIRLEVPLNEN